ncbi:MAG: 1-acyl-sn-glycerol-3-phosphate acyltransferase [Muribaculaceae bacterium]|nr:1-acyl-sn-glycerol-3-phosphate acyltransferase [Muribaculaceae bacterium]MBQ7204859.1 1-acyl-sn-glycerol-3-phosphate acyltransferase [Muribaculaceae bacterium]
MKIDVDKVLRERLPKHYKFIPRFVVRWLERTICQDQLNAILVKMAGKDNSVDAATAALDEMGITVEASGLERLPQGRFMFVSNHPLGGLDGLALISLLGNHYERHIKFIVNDLLWAVEPLRGVFLPVNKYGRQSRAAAADIETALESDNQFITFPAGLCSRMQPDGTIADLTWQKSAVIQAANHQRDVVPIFFDARNSKFFYRFAKWRKKLGIKFNIELIFLPKEMIKQSGSTLHIAIGEPIPWTSLDAAHPKQEAARLRDIVYTMASAPSKT